MSDTYRLLVTEEDDTIEWRIIEVASGRTLFVHRDWISAP